ncbi:uncharacterized protein [Battus philenor]|uniref:uncharacterized protein n=1 Tax=Battus philenor TaxID=42288 RepID=UPI0035CF1201
MTSESNIKKGKPLHGQSREIIYNVYKYFLNEAELFKMTSNRLYFKKVQERVAEATGVSRRTLNRILNEIDNENETSSTSHKFDTPKKGKAKKEYLLHLDSFDYEIIRRMIYDFHLSFHELPTLNSLKLKLLEAIDFRGSEKTLRRILRQMGFRFKKMEDNRRVLMEKYDVRLKRIEYLDKIRNYRTAGKNIIYMDESYINTSYAKGKNCSDKNEIGVKKPIAKGQRLIIVHAGNEKGFVPSAFWMFKSTDSAGDYHIEMNSENYEKWLQTQLIPNIPNNSVLVIDDASYHNKYVEKPPNSNTIKQEMIDWLMRHNIPIDQNLTKPQIYEIVCKHKGQLTEFSVDKILADHGHIVLRLPPYHSHFNPIESIWAQLRGYIASKNIDINLTGLKKLLIEKVNMIGPEDWKKHCDHVIECEEVYRRYEHALDAYCDRLKINTADSDDDDDLESTDSEVEL